MQNRHDEFHKKYYWGKNCTPITTGNTIIGLLYSIMQVTYEDHGAKIAKYFQRKINRIDEVYFCTCIYIQYTQDICVNNYQLKMKLL